MIEAQIDVISLFESLKLIKLFSPLLENYLGKIIGI